MCNFGPMLAPTLGLNEVCVCTLSDKVSLNQVDMVLIQLHSYCIGPNCVLI